MKIKSLYVENFRGIRQAELNFSYPLTLILGINGMGKTTFLDASALMLSWLVARIRQSTGSGHYINPLRDIHNEASYANLSITLDDKQKEYTWTMTRTRTGRKASEHKSDYQQLSDYTNILREHIDTSQENCNIPVFVYYSTNRAVLDIPLRVRTKHPFTLLETYDGSLTSGADFRTFFEWFRNREDLENENYKYLNQATKIQNLAYPDRQLEAVRHALSEFLPEYNNLSVRRHPLRMTIIKKDKELRFEQLSNGEKCLIAMIGDLARRLAIANAIGNTPLAGEGVVLIDEIDLHLHPEWQRIVPKKLTEIFPNCQFIISTHSPQVIGEIKQDAVRALSMDDKNGIVVTTPRQTIGLTSNDILNEVMRPEDGPETLSRSIEVEKELHRLFELIDNEEFDQARDLIVEQKNKLKGDIPDIIRAESLITMLEGEKNKP
jgi:predicted ATP-binding protein involved in virulence